MGIIAQIGMLLILAGVAKAAMDAEAHRPSLTVWARWAEEDTRWGRFWKMWSGSNSWQNKHTWAIGKPWIIKMLLKTSFVWVTDLWHFAQTVFLSCLQLAIIMPLFLYLGLTGAVNPTWANLAMYALGVLICKGLMGLPFEMCYSVIFRRHA